MLQTAFLSQRIQWWLLTVRFHIIAWSLTCISKISNTKVAPSNNGTTALNLFLVSFIPNVINKEWTPSSPQAHPSLIRLILMPHRHVMWAWLRCRVLQWSLSTDWQQLRPPHYIPLLGQEMWVWWKGKYPLHRCDKQLCFFAGQASRRLWTCLCGNSLYFFNNAKDTHVRSTLCTFFSCAFYALLCADCVLFVCLCNSMWRSWTSLVLCHWRMTAAGTETWRQPDSFSAWKMERPNSQYATKTQKNIKMITCLQGVKMLLSFPGT